MLIQLLPLIVQLQLQLQQETPSQAPSKCAGELLYNGICLPKAWPPLWNTSYVFVFVYLTSSSMVSSWARDGRTGGQGWVC